MSSSTPPPKKKARHGDAKVSTTAIIGGAASSVERTTAPIFPHISVELWVEVVEFLCFDESMRLCEVSRMFLKEVMPRKELLAVEAHNLFPGFAKRLLGTKCIVIEGFFGISEGTDWELVFHELATMQLPLFLSHLPSIEFIHLRGLREVEEEPGTWKGVDLFKLEKPDGQKSYFDSKNSQTARAFVRSICGMISSGCLPARFEIHDLLRHPICTDRKLDEYNDQCDHCRTLCQSYKTVCIMEALAGCDTHSMDENVICLHPEAALDLLKKRHNGIGALAAIVTGEQLLIAVENEKIDFIQALVDMHVLPRVERSQIDSFAFGSQKNIKKPRIFKRLYDLLLSKGIPLKVTDFSRIFDGEDEFRECSGAYESSE